jgi:hypothetical protein
MIQPVTTTWMTPLVDYLSQGKLPADKMQAVKLQTKALQYQLQDGILYRRSYLGPLLRCVTPEEANYLIREVHMGICGIHAGPRAVVAKIMNAGYYWPGMHPDAVEVLQKCQSCQKHTPMTWRP